MNREVQKDLGLIIESQNDLLETTLLMSEKNKKISQDALNQMKIVCIYIDICLLLFTLYFLFVIGRKENNSSKSKILYHFSYYFRGFACLCRNYCCSYWYLCCCCIM